MITVGADNKLTDASTVFRLTKHTTENNKYSLSTQGLNVQSQTADNTAFPATADDAVYFNFVTSTPSVVSITNEDSRVDDNKDGSLHEATDGWTVHGVVNWSASAANSKWVIEEATYVNVTLNGPVDNKYYATLCLPFDVTISGATAYTMTDNGTYLKATEVTDNKVPAGTPVLLKGDAATATATINTGDAFGQALDCALTGTYVDKAVSGADDYFLGSNGTAVGFYHWQGSTLKANRAYLPAGQNSKGFALVFDDDDPTAIASAINGQMVNGQYFDLQGRKVNKPQHGVYIMGGKKVVVK